MLKGKIFQSLLAGLREVGAAHGGGVELSARGEVGSLRQGAEADRGSVKIADDNDIKAARCALETCRDFFDSLEQLATLRRGAAFDTMQSLL